MRKVQMKSIQSGFTLIELVVVIVILGILAATAIPRFTDMSGQARIAKMRAAEGALKSGAATSHAAFLVQAAGSKVMAEGKEITMASGYPDVVDPAKDSGIVLAAGDLADYELSVDTAAKVLTVTPDSSHGACKVTYTEAAANAAPVIDSTGLNDANCK